MTSYLTSRHGIDVATEVAEFEYANLQAVADYVKESKVDCDFQLTRAVEVQLSEKLNTAMKKSYDRLVEAGSKLTKENVFYINSRDAEMVRCPNSTSGAI